MRTTLLILQAVFAVLLALSILLQQRGAGLSSTFGGQGGFYTSKRGAEKFLERATIVLGLLFVINAVAFLFI
ncbi:MAG: preprotein translocase subunit SecG [Candidatus Gracilibacteria bacterium]|nr:preprotein translocase subunit SecG [Candidatus Gracilibacteria bacterium]